MRPIKLVGGARQKIAAQVFHIDESVRGVLHGININDGAGGLSHCGQGLHIVDATGQVTRVIERQ